MAHGRGIGTRLAVELEGVGEGGERSLLRVVQTLDGAFDLA